MNYKKQSATLLILALGLGLQACSKEEVEIVSFTPTYTLDQNAISVDTPTPYQYNENNIIRYNGASELIFAAKLTEGGGATMASNQVTLNFTLRRPFTEATEFVLEEDRSLLDNYTENKEGFVALPEGTIEPLRFTIPANQNSASATISVTNVERLTNQPGYLTAFRIKPVNEQATLQFSRNSDVLYLRVKVGNAGFIGGADNGALVTSKEASWSKIATNRFTHSTTSTRAIAPLFNGSYTDLWYDGSQQNIDITLNETSKVNGVGFFVASGYVSSYPITSVTIMAQEENSSDWVSQGQFTPNRQSEFYIKFNQAIDAKKIRVIASGNTGSFWVLSELELY